jgi:hypothetical protein
MIYFLLMKKSGGARNADDADENPKRIQQRVGEIAFQQRAPSQDDGVCRIYNPNEHERALRAEPAHEAETADAHQDAGEFQDFYVFADKGIQQGCEHGLDDVGILVLGIKTADSAADCYLSLTRGAKSFNFIPSGSKNKIEEKL